MIIELSTLGDYGSPCACHSIMAAGPLWDQLAALLPDRLVYHLAHPLGCHRPRIPDRIVSGRQVQVLRFGCSHEAIADSACSATTMRARRDEWIAAGIFAQLKQIALDAYDRMVGPLDRVLAVASPARFPAATRSWLATALEAFVTPLVLMRANPPRRGRGSCWSCRFASQQLPRRC